MKNIYTTTLRLNLDKTADREAWKHLHRLNKAEYRSVNCAIISAINGWFERQERLAADPYLETREKEDAFLRQITEAIQAGLRAVPMSAIPVAPSVLSSQSDDEDLSAALDFADSF